MRLRNFAVTALLGLTTAGVACTGRVVTTATPQAAAPGVTVGPVTDVSRTACAADNAEVISAAARDLVYAAWICGSKNRPGIGFARSADGGTTWSEPVIMPGSSGAWDPAIAVAPDGTVYVSFMRSTAGHSFPVVDVSRDQGKTFPESAAATAGSQAPDEPGMTTGSLHVVPRSADLAKPMPVRPFDPHIQAA